MQEYQPEYQPFKYELRNCIDKYREEIIPSINEKENELAILMLEDLRLRMGMIYKDKPMDTLYPRILGIITLFQDLQRELSNSSIDEERIKRYQGNIEDRLNFIELAAVPKEKEKTK